MPKIHFNPNTTEFMLKNMKPIEEKPREYLGMSGIADECARKLWLSFRFASKKIVERRGKDIFERGDLEEERIIKRLKELGFFCFRVDKNGNEIEITGKIKEEQEEFIAGFGHAKGHCDGRIRGLPESKKDHGLEIKTMNDKYFNDFVKNGLKKSHPVYYGQVQRYMKEMKLDRFLVVARNKNDESIHAERIRYEKEFAENLVSKENNIILSDDPFGQKFPATWFKCKMCLHKSVCHDNAPPEKTCRSCEFADIYEGGVWACSKQDDKKLTLDEQLAACGKYKRSF